MTCNVTYEDLAALAAGELEGERCKRTRRHLAECDSCRARLDALARVDQSLKHLKPARPPAAAVLAARRALSGTIRGQGAPEILTLAEAAEFLRISPEQLGEIVEELPAFELAGQMRIRRERLVEWVRQRERDYTRQQSAGWAARARVGRVGAEAAEMDQDARSSGARSYRQEK